MGGILCNMPCSMSAAPRKKAVKDLHKTEYCFCALDLFIFVFKSAFQVYRAIGGEKTDTEPISGFSFIIIAYWWLQDLHCPAAGRNWSCNRYLNIVAKDDRSARAACFYWIYMLMSCSSAPAAQWQLRHTCEPMNRSVIERLSIQPEMAEFCIQQRSGQERYLHCALMAMKAMTGTHHDCVVDWDFPADIKRWWWSIIELVRQRDFCWLW